MEQVRTRQEYRRDLIRVQEKVTKMGELSASAVKRAMQAFLSHDCVLAKQVMEEDDQIDDMIIEIEDRCILLIAKQQPIAHDLRVLATGFKISTDIERIGDHAFDIAKTTLELQKESAHPLDAEYTPQLAECAIRMVEKAIEAYEKGDVVLAEKVCREDDVLDEWFAKTFLELSGRVAEDAEQAKQITRLLFIARFLERIGDHATNIAEWVIYLETAERIRKNGKPRERKE